jgi:hypothetical protein
MRRGQRGPASFFEASKAKEKILVLRDLSQLADCGAAGARLRQSATKICDYNIEGTRPDGSIYLETFHAKVVLADGLQPKLVQPTSSIGREK